MIKKYQNVFSFEDYLKIREYLSEPNWSYGHKSIAHSSKYFWKMELSENKFFSEELFSRVKELIGEYDVEKVYANGQTYGLEGEFHYDCSPSDTSRYTFLYYCNEDWNPSFLGYTVFRDSNGDITHYYPEPNSAIIFPGNILHYGQAPSRDFHGLRMTLAYKLRKV